MQWLDDAYLIGFLTTLALGILLYLVTGAMYLYTGVAGLANTQRVRRLQGHRTEDLGTTSAKIGDIDYQVGQAEIRKEIEDWGAWDAQRGVYAVEVPERERRPYDDHPVRHYVWVKPPYVFAAVKASPLTAASAALLLSFALGSIMWGGLHFGFSAGGLPQAVWDKYHVSVEDELPDDPGVNQRFEDVTVLVPTPTYVRPGYGDPLSGCSIDAGSGIETLIVACPDKFGEMHELFPFPDTPQEWFP